MAANNRVSTHSESFMETEGTTSMTAVYAPFVAAVLNEVGPHAIDTAISISNVTANPGGIGNTYYNPSRMIGEVDGMSGTATVYLYSAGGMLYTHTTDEIGSGETTAFLLSEVVGELGLTVFSGYAWVIADFGAVAGTVTNFWTILGTSGTYVMNPSRGGTPIGPVAPIGPTPK